MINIGIVLLSVVGLQFIDCGNDHEIFFFFSPSLFGFGFFFVVMGSFLLSCSLVA